LAETQNLLARQNFENRFFNLLRVQDNISKSCVENVHRWYHSDGVGMKSENKGVKRFEGREIFRHISDELRGIVSRIRLARDGKVISKNEGLVFYDLEVGYLNQYGLDCVKGIVPDLSSEQVLKQGYKQIFEWHNNSLAHYFRHLYHIIEFVDINLKDANKEEENEVVRKQTEEYYRHFMNLIQSQMSASELFLLFCNGLSFEESKTLINEYKLLENLAIEDLPDPALIKLYPDIKFKSREEIFGG
jgi:hypothetical protein